MKLLFTLLPIFSSISANSTCGIRLSKQNNRFGRSIIGGNYVTSSSKWPWQVYVNECGGTIISPQWVLTAAHCVSSSDASNVTVTAGVTQIDGYETSRQAFAVHAHSRYDNKTMENDIALVKLETALDYSDDVAPICLPARVQLIPRDGQAVVTGFGMANVRGTNETLYDNQLRETVVPIIPPEVCDERYYNLPPQHRDEEEGRAIIESWSRKKIVCAGSHGHGSAWGDSGGPLMMKATDGRWFQIGIVSFGVPDQQEFDTYPNVYTDVRKYCGWISETTKGEASCQEEEVTLEDVPIRA